MIHVEVDLAVAVVGDKFLKPRGYRRKIGKPVLFEERARGRVAEPLREGGRVPYHPRPLEPFAVNDPRLRFAKGQQAALEPVGLRADDLF